MLDQLLLRGRGALPADAALPSPDVPLGSIYDVLARVAPSPVKKAKKETEPKEAARTSHWAFSQVIRVLLLF